MPIPARSLLLTLSTLALTSAAPAGQAVLQADPQSISCPVTLTAELRPEGRILPATFREGDTTRRRVHISLSSTEGRTLRAAEVVLHGDRIGLRPASGGSSTQEVTRSFNITHDAAGAGPLTADLSLANVTGITRVTLSSIDYASAPAWHTSKSSTCVTVPTSNHLLSSLR